LHPAAIAPRTTASFPLNNRRMNRLPNFSKKRLPCYAADLSLSSFF
jgi:hypothetical protein